MKKFLAFASVLFLCVSNIGAHKSCQDNSWHLQKKYDNKELHPVQCNCPCGSSYRYKIVWSECGRCNECKHYHLPNDYYAAERMFEYSSARKIINNYFAQAIQKVQ